MNQAQITTEPSVRFAETTASVLLDALRGIAAILVLLDHWRNAFFVDYPQIQHHRMLLGSLYLLCAAGHQAVVIFFVLSGFLVGGSVLRSFQRQEWNWARYLTHRLVRLWTVLLPALLLGAFWDHLGIWVNHAPALYSGALYNHMTPNVGQALSLVDLAGNLAFVQTILVPTYGSNSALWSLSNEFWYYIAFPLAACLMGRIYRRFARILLCAVILCSIGSFVPMAIWSLFPVWLLGALLHAAPKRQTAIWLRVLVSIAYAILFLGLVALDHKGWSGQGLWSDSILGLGTFGFLWVLLGAVKRAKKHPAVMLARSTAKFSYTMYAAHTPLLVFLVSLMTRDTRWVPTTKSIASALAILLIVIAYVLLLGMATESRTDKLRTWIEGKLALSNNRPEEPENG